MKTNNLLTLELFVVDLGCDILPEGITCITPYAVWKEIKQMKKDHDIREDEYRKIYNHIMSFLLENDKSKRMTEIHIHTYCQAYLYQTTLEIEKKKTCHHVNIYSIPQHLCHLTYQNLFFHLVLL